MDPGLTTMRNASVSVSLGQLTGATMSITGLGSVSQPSQLTTLLRQNEMVNLSDMNINLNMGINVNLDSDMDPGIPSTVLNIKEESEIVEASAPQLVEDCQMQLHSTPKRRRSVLTLQQKLEIIERVKKGDKVTKLAAEYGVGKATISDLKRQEDKINAFVSKLATASSQNRKTMRKPQDERVEKALHIWLTREKEKGTQISGPLLMEKAKAFHKQLYGDSNDKFKASTGWLHRFKLRNGITHQKPSRKKVPIEIDTSIVDVHLDRLRGIIRDGCLGPDQIYTADKTMLHWRALPFKENGEKDLKPSKDCVIVLGCVNATGSHKLRLALIGKQKSLWAFGNANVSKMPFCYYTQDNGWMDADTFCEWFHNEFVTAVRAYYEGAGQAARALLLIDDAPLQTNGVQIMLHSDDNNIQCMVLPSVASFITQSINNQLFENIKRKYRKKLFLRALAVHPGKRLPCHLSDLSKWITLKDVGYMLSEAWGVVGSDTIRKLWRNTLYCLGAVSEQAGVVDELLKKVDERETEGINDPLGSLVDDVLEITSLLKQYDENLSEDDVAHWLSMDTESPSLHAWSDWEIIETVRSEVEDVDGSSSNTAHSEDQAEAAKVHVPSDSEAYTCFTKCLTWLESQSDCEPSYLQILWKLQNMAAQRKKVKK